MLLYLKIYVEYIFNESYELKVRIIKSHVKEYLSYIRNNGKRGA